MAEKIATQLPDASSRNRVSSSGSAAPFGLRLAHSITGVVPTGVFLVMHLWAIHRALDGPVAHRDALTAVHPSGWAAQSLIFVPLLFHVGYGLVLTARPRYNVDRYPLSRNWTYTLQRVSGVLALAFMALVAALFWSHTRPEQLAWGLARELSTTSWGVPAIAFAFLLGTAACCLHLAVGLWTIGTRYGVWTPRPQRARAGAICAILGAAAFAWGAHSIVFVATGWRLGSGPSRPSAAVCNPSAVRALLASPSSSTSAASTSTPASPSSASSASPSSASSASPSRSSTPTPTGTTP